MFDPFDPEVMESLRALHPDATEPVQRLPREQLPEAPTFSKRKLRKTAKKMDETSAVGPDGMSVNHPSLL